LRGPTSKGEGGEEGKGTEGTEGRGRDLLRRGGGGKGEGEKEGKGGRGREEGRGLPYHFSGTSAALCLWGHILCVTVSYWPIYIAIMTLQYEIFNNAG